MGTTGTEVHFLSEGNLPRNARLVRLSSSSSATQEDDRQLAEAMTESQTDSGSSEAVVPPGGQSSGGSASGDPVVSDAGIQQIMTAGFTQEEAIAELREAGGDVDRALSRLIARSFKF